MNFFLKKNKNKKFVVLDVPLLLENKLNKTGDILIFVSSKNRYLKKINKKKNFNRKLFNKFQKFNFQHNIKPKNLILLLKMILPKNN